RQQPNSEQEQWLIHYNAVIKSGNRSYYCTGETKAKLFYQVGSLLAQLGMHQGDKRLLVLSDAAGWINNWVAGCGIAEKESILCWYHLRDRCRRLIAEAFTNKVDRLAVRKALLKYLWRGQTDKAISYIKKLIEDVEDNCSQFAVKSIEALKAIQKYLITR